MMMKDGKWREYNKHAVLIAEGIFLNGVKHGTWREYYDDNGAIMIEENYQHGIQHGPYLSFHPNGQLCSIGKFINGSREGYFRVYDENGHHSRNLFFINNIKIEDSDELAYIAEGAAETKPGD